MEHLTFWRWLKLRRSGLGLTQAQLGEQIGYAGETVRKFETLERTEYERTEAALRAELTEEQFAQARAVGQAWCFEQVVAYALGATEETS